MFDNKSKDAWLLERHGSFTASLIGKIMLPGKNGAMFSPGGLTYIRQVAIEKMTDLYDRPELENVASLFHGKAYEEPAYEYYVHLTKNYSMRYFGSYDPLYLSYNKDSGGSPDGIMGEGENIEWGLELKCPKNPAIHFDYLQFKDQWDLKEYDLGYYSQSQFLLMITKAKGWHWGSYDERFKSPKLKCKILEIKPDLKFQNELEVRLLQAIKERNKIIASMAA
jgi:hypothetical protein